LGERETNRYRALLLAWCERYEAAGWPLETPAYALSNYALLLREAGAREKLYRLSGAPWRRRRLAQTGSYAGYVDDLWFALEAAAEPPADLVEVVRASMRVGQLVSGLDDVHPAALAAFVRIGQPERATEYLNLITHPAKGAEACLRVADACRQSPPGPYWTPGGEAATGESGFWGVIMRLLRDLRKVEPPRLRADLHTRAAELLTAVGEADIARNFAADAWDIGAAIEASRSRAAAFAGLAGALVEVGWSDHLPELVMRTEAAMAELDAPDQATLRLALSVATARAGLGELTERLLAPVDLARLVEALRPVDWCRDVSLDVVRALMALERRDDAQRLARAPESNLAVAGNLAEIALHLRERGQASVNLERETTTAIQEWLAERKMNSTVRESQPEQEFRTGHRSNTTFVVIPESSAHQDRAFRFLAAKSSPAWCLRAVAELPRGLRLRGLAVLAEEFARLGHKTEAETMAMESLDLHEDSDVAHVLEELHMGFACRLAELGAPDAAARIGGLLRDRGRRRHVDIALAVHWVSACEPACAAAACQAATAEMPPGKEDLVVVRRAVSTLLDLRDYAGALTLALSVQDADARLLGLSLLAAGCFAAGVETEGVAAYQAALATALSQKVSAAETYLEFFTLIGGAMNNPEDFVDYIAKMSAGQAVGDTYGYWMQSQALLRAAERWKSDRLREAAAESMREKLGSAELTAADVWTRMAAYGMGARLLQQAGLKREAAETAADCLAACREGFTEWYSSG
jgi:hypothetical protein